MASATPVASEGGTSISARAARGVRGLHHDTESPHVADAGIEAVEGYAKTPNCLFKCARSSSMFWSRCSSVRIMLSCFDLLHHVPILQGILLHSTVGSLAPEEARSCCNFVIFCSLLVTKCWHILCLILLYYTQ